MDEGPEAGEKFTRSRPEYVRLAREAGGAELHKFRSRRSKNSVLVFFLHDTPVLHNER